jgi:hypothetical protein
MASRFTFDGALMFAFRAAHARSFIWKFALAFAGISTILSALGVWLMKDTLIRFIEAIEQLDASGIDDPGIVFGTIFNVMGGLIPLGSC